MDVTDSSYLWYFYFKLLFKNNNLYSFRVPMKTTLSTYAFIFIFNIFSIYLETSIVQVY